MKKIVKPSIRMKILSLLTMGILMLSACHPSVQLEQKQGQVSEQARISQQQDQAKDKSRTQEGSAKEQKSSEEQKGVYQKISAEEAKRMMDEQEVIIVDVRTQGEYDGGHIENALLIPNESIGKESPEQLPDKSAVILLYCRSGNRSRQAAHKLLELGYQNVYDFGGIGDWSYGLVK